MSDSNKIKEIMKTKGISDKAVASALNIDLSTWYRRLLAPEKITIGEALALKDLLNLSIDEASIIFLS